MKAPPRQGPLRVLGVAGYDSFLRAAGKIARIFADGGAEVEFALLSTRQDQISESQVRAEALPFPIHPHQMDTLLADGLLERYDVVLLALEGASSRNFFLRLAELGDDRPLVVSFYPGIVLRYPFDGLSSRSPADVLWLNSDEDLASYREMCASFGVSADNASVFGIPHLLSRIERSGAADGPVVFFEQTVIPRAIEDRTFLASGLIDLARRHPDRQVIVKPRHRVEDFTLHKARVHIEPLISDLAAGSGGMPRNLTISHEPASALLARASLCLTISSTVAIEAVNAGVPTAIIGDFGAHDDSGIHYFYGSNLIRCMAMIDPAEPPVVDPQWARRRVVDPLPTAPQAVARVTSAAQQARNEPLPPIRVSPLYFSSERQADLLAKHGPDRISSRSYQNDSKPRKKRKRGLARFWR